MTRILKGRAYNPGSKTPINNEKRLDNVDFNIFKFNNRTKPTDIKKILVITCFSEFGCETIGAMYCIPRILQAHPGYYVICVGWYGREYLYRHLADEFWEMKEEHQWLREYCRAFHHNSNNLLEIEKSLNAHGRVLYGASLSSVCINNICLECHHNWSDFNAEICPKCNTDRFQKSIFGDVSYHKRTAVRLPRPSLNKIKEARKYLLPNSIGIFARNRLCYGRNLPGDFYEKLISTVRKNGYNVIWLGEKQTTLECPVDNVIDFSRMPQARDLELTLAIVTQLEFTIQFWTASSRLAAMMGIPYILFESPDQIVGQGQEGYRLALATDENKKKLILTHYLSIKNDHQMGLDLTTRAIKELEGGNYESIICGLGCDQYIKQNLENKQLGIT